MEKKMIPPGLISKEMGDCMNILVSYLKQTDIKLVDIYNGFVTDVKKIFKGDRFNPLFYFVFRDYEKNMWKAACYPLLPTAMDGVTPVSMEMHSLMIKRLAKQMSSDDNSSLKLVGVLKVMDAHMAQYDKDILDKMGNVDKTKYVRPSENPQSKDVLHFELEESFIKHTKVFEYIKSDEGDIVFKEEPFVDMKSQYNATEDKNSNFAFLFTKGISYN